MHYYFTLNIIHLYLNRTQLSEFAQLKIQIIEKLIIVHLKVHYFSNNNNVPIHFYYLDAVSVYK